MTKFKKTQKTECLCSAEHHFLISFWQLKVFIHFWEGVSPFLHLCQRDAPWRLTFGWAPSTGSMFALLYSLWYSSDIPRMPHEGAHAWNPRRVTRGTSLGCHTFPSMCVIPGVSSGVEDSEFGFATLSRVENAGRGMVLDGTLVPVACIPITHVETSVLEKRRKKTKNRSKLLCSVLKNLESIGHRV